MLPTRIRSTLTIVRNSGWESVGRITRSWASLSRALAEAAGALASAESELNGRAAEVVAEDIRASLRALERLIGRIGVEDVLGAVFASFCLGK